MGGADEGARGRGDGYVTARARVPTPRDNARALVRVGSPTAERRGTWGSSAIRRGPPRDGVPRLTTPRVLQRRATSPKKIWTTA